MDIHPHPHLYSNTDDTDQGQSTGIWKAAVKGGITGLTRGLLLGAAGAVILGSGCVLFSITALGIHASITSGLAVIIPQIAHLALQFSIVSAVLDGVGNAWHAASQAHKNGQKARYAKTQSPSRVPVYPQVAMVPQLGQQQSVEPASTKWRDMVGASRAPSASITRPR